MENNNYNFNDILTTELANVPGFLFINLATLRWQSHVQTPSIFQISKSVL